MVTNGVFNLNLTYEGFLDYPETDWLFSVFTTNLELYDSYIMRSFLLNMSLFFIKMVA